jgi:hypothetical protein
MLTVRKILYNIHFKVRLSRSRAQKFLFCRVTSQALISSGQKGMGIAMEIGGTTKKRDKENKGKFPNLLIISFLYGSN